MRNGAMQHPDRISGSLSFNIGTVAVFAVHLHHLVFISWNGKMTDLTDVYMQPALRFVLFATEHLRVYR